MKCLRRRLQPSSNMMTTNRKLGLYIHIPFCLSKCLYCDFLSFSGFSDEDQSRYVQSLLMELDWYRDGREKAGGITIDILDYEVDSIFIGGGTPSLISAELIEKLLNKIHENFSVDQDCEITIEANPKTIDRHKLKAYREVGINRLSIGAQSLNPGLLDFIGRVHTPEEFLKNYEEARAAGFENINVDIMFGIPGQSLEIWSDTFQRVLDLAPQHISFYGLKIEEGTPFQLMKQNNELVELSDDLDRKMYALALSKLREPKLNGQCSNYDHYELSNAAETKFHCRHNLKYWSMDEYLGIGLGAHSYINQERFSVTRDIARYQKNNASHIDWRHTNSKEDEISEFIFTGMRKIEGISFQNYEARFGEPISRRYKNQVSKLLRGRLIELTGTGMKLTLLGIDLSNYVLSEFV